MTTVTAIAAFPDRLTESEAFQALFLIAERRTGRIPAGLIVRHILSVTANAGWPVQRAALEAVLRRITSARQDGLAVASSPAGVFGMYTTRRKGSPERPYRTLLEQLVDAGTPAPGTGDAPGRVGCI